MVLHPIAQVDMATVDCGCTFGAMYEDSTTEPATDSPNLIVLDVNGKPPAAYINLGAGDVSLQPKTEISFPLYECVAEEPFKTIWVADDFELTVDVDAAKAGYEACRFYGVASISDDDLLLAKPITGSCGC
jgi:hypothetical protein